MSNDKKFLSFGTEVPDDQTVLGIEFTGRTIAACIFLCRGRGCSASAKECIGLVAFITILPVAGTCMAGLPADLPVLFRILHNTHIRFHKKRITS
jgi:hypothetical protein